MNSQLNEMKLLYENTKATSTELEDKIEGLKKVMTQQVDSLHSGVPNQGGGFAQGGFQPQAMFGGDGVLDPTLLQKGISQIKDQMKDVQREAFLIENEMEKRFSDMLNRNSQRRYLPKTLTDEVIEEKRAAEVEALREIGGEKAAEDLEAAQAADPPSNYVTKTQTRKAIQERLGGHFDYISFNTGLREEMQKFTGLRKEFKAGVLKMPDLVSQEEKRAAPYDFSIPAFDTPAPINQMVGGKQLKVTYDKPRYLDEIETEPKYIIDFDPRELEDAARTGVRPKPYQEGGAPPPS